MTLVVFVVLEDKLKGLDELVVGVFEVSPLLVLNERKAKQLEIEKQRIFQNQQVLHDLYFTDSYLEDPLEAKCLSFDVDIEAISLTEEHKIRLKDFKFKSVFANIAISLIFSK